MTKYKKLLKVLLAVIFEDNETNVDLLAQIVLRHGFKHNYVELDERGNIALTKKGEKFIAD